HRPGRALHAARPHGVRHRPGLGPQGDDPLMSARPDGIALEARDLRKAFGGVRAVDGCSFAVPMGKISGLIGPNGSGKTTTFNLLTGLAAPDEQVRSSSRSEEHTPELQSLAYLVC